MARAMKYLAMFAVVLLTPALARASYGIYVGKNLTVDGSVFLAGYGDEPSSHWLEIVPRRRHGAGAMIAVGATEEARYPGKLIKIPQVPVTFKYLTMNYSSFAGFPAPLTNGGLNEHHVAGRDIWSPSRKELREMTPRPQTGLNYSDLSRIAMERARTAREAVEIIGTLIDKHGYATYGGNSHLFADSSEGWIFINFAGGQKLWVAQRLGPDDIRVSRPGYIGDVPLDYQKHPDFLGSANLLSFAVKQGWYDAKSGQAFNVNKVYGDGLMRHEAVEMMEKRLHTLKGKIGIKEVMAAVRPVEITRDTAGYGQVAHLRKGVHAELGVLWVAGASPLTAPFTPFHLGVSDVPPEFKRHRYLTAGEADRFQDLDHQGLESTRFAFRTFKRLFYLTKEHEKKFLPEVTEALEAFEAKLIAQQPSVERTAEKLFQAGAPELARHFLTYYSSTEALNGMRLADDLAVGIEARTRVLYGIRPPKGTEPEPPRKRGTATVEQTRPDRFPHRIWAACDFEAQTPDYAWFGPTETKNIPSYPGNLTALGVKEKPYGNFSALMTGINPVPGPMMGKLNKMYCRYYLKGGTEATFQHFSLSVNDNNHIRVSGLTAGKWSEVTLNFTRDAARNDGSPKAFQKGERMDDLKVFVGKPKDGRDYELYLDDIIFFDDDPDIPQETEPFPNRVIFLAAFDTGIDPKSKPKYWPGAFEVLTKSKGAPDDSYWGVAQAVPHKETKGKWIRLEIKPPRPVGAHTKLRFRYFLKGTSALTAQVFDLTDGDNRHIHLKGLKPGAWQWAIVDFTNDAKRNDGKTTPFAAGHKVDDIFFFVRPESDQEVQLYVDEVTLFDAGQAGK